MRSTLMLFANASTDEEAVRALEAWVKLKSVLVLPLRGGRRRQGSKINFQKDLMVRWLAEKHDECWSTAIGIEKERQKGKQKRKKKAKRGKWPDTTETLNSTRSAGGREQKNASVESSKGYKRAKELVNAGELSKAMSAILSNGIAPINDDVLSQLRAKHPQRREMVILSKVGKMPSMNGIIRNDQEDMRMDEDEISNPGDCGQSRDSKEERFPALTVSDDDILAAAKQAKRLTSGGLQQITPWHYDELLTSPLVLTARLSQQG